MNPLRHTSILYSCYQGSNDIHHPFIQRTMVGSLLDLLGIFGCQILGQLF